MKQYFLGLMILGLFGFACSGHKVHGEGKAEVKIRRFDQALYDYLQGKSSEEAMTKDYKPFLDLFGKQVIQIGATDSSGFYDRLKAFFKDASLMKLYQDELSKYADVTALEKELTFGLDILAMEFPQLKLPDLYMHVSGLNQNIVLTDDILSVSADKYLGRNYPFYQDFFYDYQRKKMDSTQIVPDYFLGFLMANFPFKGNGDVLLDRMIYEGKLHYILMKLIPDRKIHELIAYDEAEYAWCEQNALQIWKTILENQHLYTPSNSVTSRYINETPHTPFLSTQSPGRVGIWLGFQVVSSFMKEHPETSIADLMEQVDYPDFLKKSKYKP